MRKTGGLEYEILGYGEPVLFIHGSIFCDSYAALIRKSELASYQRVVYRRRGYAGSAPNPGAFSIADAAGDARMVMKGLDIAYAHVVGHSYGACVALQLALDAPSAVHSLAVLEPPLMGVPSGLAFRDGVAPAMQRYAAGDREGTVHSFIGMMAGENWRSGLEAMVPGGPAQAVKDIAAFCEVELKAVGEWQFDAQLAQRIEQPAMLVLGSKSGPFFSEGVALAQNWLPNAETVLVSGANHLLHQQNDAISREMAGKLAAFFGRHPFG